MLGKQGSCVFDAYSMKKYLLDCQQVPEDHILVLTDQRATRENILRALRYHFIDNDRINYGDAMLFYFAGPGGQCKHSPGWLELSPYNKGRSDDHGIPDPILFALLGIAAHKHGNNIITILDCSLSGTRRRTRQGRAQETQKSVPIHLDPSLNQDIWDNWIYPCDLSRIPVDFLDFWCAKASYVLLAACDQVFTIIPITRFIAQ
jgi:hypothetical protein